MTAEGEGLTMTDLLAAVSEYLCGGGYQRIGDAGRGEWPTESVRLFEDPYGIVAVVVYDTWHDLLSGWIDAQDALVQLISRHISKSDAKAWDGYLVLLTPGVMASDTRNEATQIRYDTGRVRKLLATGDDLKSLADVERALLPLLPLEPELELEEQESVLDMLPNLLSTRGIPDDVVRVVIEAFSEERPLVERLHAYRTKT
jgi:hypothetical protein